MSDAGETGALDAPEGQGLDAAWTIATLRDRGAHRIDPVGFRFIEALDRRAAAQGGEVRRLLALRLAKLLAACGERVESARSDAGNTVARIAANFPDAAVQGRRLFNEGDFKGLQKFAASLPPGQAAGGPLAELVRQLDRHAAGQGADAAADNAAGRVAPPAELKALRHHRRTWSRLIVDQQLSQSSAKVPGNAGPLNSHRLVLQSLQSLRALSPDYLDRYMSYVDALLWLDQVNGGGAPAQGAAVRTDGDKKRKPGRSRPG